MGLQLGGFGRADLSRRGYIHDERRGAHLDDVGRESDEIQSADRDGAPDPDLSDEARHADQKPDPNDSRARRGRASATDVAPERVGAA